MGLWRSDKITGPAQKASDLAKNTKAFLRSVWMGILLPLPILAAEAGSSIISPTLPLASNTMGQVNLEISQARRPAFTLSNIITLFLWGWRPWLAALNIRRRSPGARTFAG